MPPIQQKTPRTRIQGRAVVETLCDCPGHPHNFHTTEVEVDQVVVEDGRKDMPIKALKDHFGKKRWREVASHTWSVGPTLTPLQPGELMSEPVSESVTHLFVVDTASYFVNRIKKGETDVHTG